MPSKPPELTWRDYLLMLLDVAAETEHALMVQYLYAAYSLGGPQVPEEQRHLVARWQRSMLTIAREEMGHLLSVLNLTCLLGGPIELDRGNFPWDTPYYPFPFRLEPLTLESLSCYVYAEMPPATGADAFSGRPTVKRYREFEREDRERIQKAVTERQKGHAGQAHSVGELYELILGLVRDRERISDEDFHAETLAFQGSWDDWGRGYRPGDKRLDPGGNVIKPPAFERGPHVIAATMSTRTQAITALREVAGQGEAPQLGDRRKEPSHFDRFLEIYQDFERIDGWQPARPVAVDPSTQSPAYTMNQGAFIEHDRSRRWGNLFNLRYRMLLMYLGHVYRLGPGRRGDPNLRGMVIHRVFGEMYNLKTIAGLLVAMPLCRDETDPRRAGPPFEMPYSIALPTAELDAWRLHRELLASAEDLTDWILRTEDGEGKAQDGGPEHVRYLKTLRDNDRQAAVWLDRVIAGGTVAARAAMGGRAR